MTNITAGPVPPEQYAQWNRLTAIDPEATIYQNAGWLVPVSEACGDELVLLGFYEDGRLAAGLPFQVRRRGGLTIARRAFGTPYSGLLCMPGLDQETRGKLDRAVADAVADYSTFSVACAPNAAVWPFGGAGWRVADRATWMIRLKNENEMWESLGQPLQKKIRRTCRRGARVTDEGDPEDLYRLYVATFARRRLRPPFHCDGFVRMVGRLVDEQIGRVYVASWEGRPCSARLVLFDGRRAYCAFSGFDPTLAHLRTGDLLMWEVMRRVSSTRKELDLVGANLPGISEYKRKFGGVLCPYVELTRWKSRAKRAAIRFYQWVTQSRRGSARA